MKNSFKLVLVIPFLAMLFLAMTQESKNATIPGKTEEVSSAYSITVFTNPPCYTGSCTATRKSDGTVYSIPVSGSSYTLSLPTGVPVEGIYDIYVCCGGRSGTATVTVGPSPNNQPSITVNLTGYCETSDD